MLSSYLFASKHNKHKQVELQSKCQRCIMQTKDDLHRYFISQGSVMTSIRYGGAFNDGNIATVRILLNAKVEEN